MTYQTIESPCYSCDKLKCDNCCFCVYARDLTLFNKGVDIFIENLWRECTDIVWDESDNGELVLGQQWRGFPVGEFTEEDWYRWIDFHHSKGIGWVFENISPYDFERGD